MFEFKAIKELFENLRARFEVLKASWIIKLENNLIYSFLKKRREWITASLRNYSLFLLWGSTSLALVRFFQMWATDSRHLINFYYSSVAFSFFFTFLLISLRYLRDRGYFKKGEENREKWKAYQNFVAEKHNLKWNFRFSRSLFF